MKRATRARWRAAASLRDLGELTALWLEGALDSQPGYAAGYGPDPETVPLVPVLAAANRAGYVTEVSQPGEPPMVGRDGTVWVQRAAVAGWLAAGQVPALANAARDAGLLVLAQLVVRGRRWPFWRSPSNDDEWIDVTTENGRVCTSFGGPYRRREVASRYAEVGDDALVALLSSVSVTLAAPEYGPDERLWVVLAEWAEGQRASRDQGTNGATVQT